MTEPTTVLIVDDEPLARERLADLLGECEDVCILGAAGDGARAMELARTTQPDVAFVDLRMPGIDGLTLAQHLAELRPQPAVVFCTAYSDQALEAFQADGVDYLVKPLKLERLRQALAKARRFRAGAHIDPNARTHLSARMGSEIHRIDLDEVIYLLAEQKYVTVRHTRGKDLIEESLNSLEAEFPERLLRVHRNALVAKNRVAAIKRCKDGKHVVTFRDCDAEITISRRNLTAVRRFFAQ